MKLRVEANQWCEVTIADPTLYTILKTISIKPVKITVAVTASIISAEGDSEAAELLAKAFKSQGEGLVELRRIETAEERLYK